MKDNQTGKTLYYIGVITIIVGIIGSFICGAVFKSITYDYSSFSGYSVDETYNWSLAIIGAVASFISGMCFIGFSEIISLLQRTVNKQDEIIKKIEEQPKTNAEIKPAPKTVLQDIESNLPEM